MRRDRTPEQERAIGRAEGWSRGIDYHRQVQYIGYDPGYVRPRPNPNATIHALDDHREGFEQGMEEARRFVWDGVPRPKAEPFHVGPLYDGEAVATIKCGEIEFTIGYTLLHSIVQCRDIPADTPFWVGHCEFWTGMEMAAGEAARESMKDK